MGIGVNTTDLKKKEKVKKKRRVYLRAGIQVLFFLFFPSAYTAAFSGVKYLFTQIGAGERINMISFVHILLMLCLYTIVFGRFFCGYACAFGALGDAVRSAYVWICKKTHIKPVQIPARWMLSAGIVKYIVLAAIVLLCYGGIYGHLRGTSPWDVFSMIHAGNFKLGDYIQGAILLLLILVGMGVQERFFCIVLCPMGAIFSLLPVLPFFSLRRDRPSCLKGCSGCTKKCPSQIGLPQDGSLDVPGDCFQCQKCIDVCPKQNIHCGIQALKGNEMWFTIMRALLLLGLMVWLGV